ncbi:hypothetical protein [Archaeoglobus profundus]|uniref:Uncharacterized protein n=1 Tax=Archaeoglobus profundus (strain DSM 5631 / JCM 9629 / NBRC 100127 / Av18) TaxID=572546 RepID=D2RFW2_ARCPA|nr:hypothetical protein [Archaeoglobus profundus]ADB57187.1 hypothetical protein Arcpr_0115 [Archaeoglobus profundus DSM 5631]
MKGMNRCYFSKFWRMERRYFKGALNEWFGKLDSVNKRKILKRFYEMGLESGLFEHEVNGLIYYYFGVSLFKAGNYWKRVRILRLPTWILKEVVRISGELSNLSGRKVAHELYKKKGVWVEPGVIYLFLNRFNVEETIRVKEAHDELQVKALREVGHLEQDFILAVEENYRNSVSVYEEFSEKFERVNLQLLFFYVNVASYYPMLIDSALIDKVVENCELEKPKLWRRVMERWTHRLTVVSRP